MVNSMFDGGPAFPIDPHGTQEPGMALRDYFAAQAMLGQMLRYEKLGVPTVPPNALAQQAYLYADAMLAERAKAVFRG